MSAVSLLKWSTKSLVASTDKKPGCALSENGVINIQATINIFNHCFILNSPTNIFFTSLQNSMFIQLAHNPGSYF